MNGPVRDILHAFDENHLQLRTSMSVIVLREKALSNLSIGKCQIGLGLDPQSSILNPQPKRDGIVSTMVNLVGKPIR